MPLSTYPLCKLSVLLSSCLAALWLEGYSSGPPQPELLIAAAADLSAVHPELSKRYKQVSGQRVRFALGASGMLARQIEQGAPYDVYLSANEAFVQQLVKSGRLQADSVRVYALGRLGLWSRDGTIRQVEDLRSPRVLHVALANPVHAPYGAAARELLERRGVWPALMAKVVYGENVRQAFQFAESGNAEAVITAWSLLYDRPGATLLPDRDHTPIRQSGAVVAGRPQAAAARRFLDFLTNPEARRILESRGFGVPQP